MRISIQKAEREVDVYNMLTDYNNGRTKFELFEQGGKYHASYLIVASEDMGAKGEDDFVKKGGLVTCGASDMSARELYFFMQGVWAGEHKAAAAEGGVK